MSPEGRWVVAYDHATQQPLFTDIDDLRPTFYGLLIAYKLLGDKKYLQRRYQRSAMVYGTML